MNKEKDKYSQTEATPDPVYHAANVRKMMDDLVKHIEQDEDRIVDARALSLFETSREVLKGLITAFDHYEHLSEKAWKE